MRGLMFRLESFQGFLGYKRLDKNTYTKLLRESTQTQVPVKPDAHKFVEKLVPKGNVYQ